MSSSSPQLAIEHQPNHLTSSSAADAEAILSELDNMLDDLVWTNPRGMMERWKEAWDQRERGGSNPVLRAITRAIERRAEPLLGFQGTLFLSSYCDYDKEYATCDPTLQSTTLVHVDTSARDDIGNQCRIFQELYRDKLPVYCGIFIGTGLFEEHPEFITSLLRIAAGIFHWAEMEITELDMRTSEVYVRILAAWIGSCAWVNRDRFQLDESATLGADVAKGLTDSLTDALFYLYNLPVYNDSSLEELRQAIDSTHRLAMMCWMLDSNTPIQDPDAEHVERTEHQRRSDDMFILAMDNLAIRRPGYSDEEYRAKLTTLDQLVASDILGIYGAPTYLSRLNRLLRASDLSEELDEDLGRKLSIFRTTLIHPDVVPHLNSSGMLLTMRLLAEEQARYGYAPAEFVVLREVLGVMRAAFEGAPIPDGCGPLIRKYDFVALLARGLKAYAGDGYLIDKNERVREHGDVQSLVSILKSFQAFVTATSVRSNGKNTLRKSLRKALREQWYPTLLELQDGVSCSEGEVRSRLMRMRLLWSASGHDLGLDEAEEKAEFDRLGRLKEQTCSWKICEYHTQLPPIAVKACKGCGQTRYCSRECQSKDWKEGGHKSVCKRIKLPDP